jgi:hypothetical protein
VQANGRPVFVPGMLSVPETWKCAAVKDFIGKFCADTRRDMLIPDAPKGYLGMIAINPRCASCSTRYAQRSI